MAENKTRATTASVAALIGKISDPVQQKDSRMLVKWMEELSGEEAKVWGSAIIGVGSHHYKYESGREGDMPAIWFSPRKSALVLYSLIGYSGSEALLARLGKHSTGKGCLYIKKLSDVDAEVLKKLMSNALKKKAAQASV